MARVPVNDTELWLLDDTVETARQLARHWQLLTCRRWAYNRIASARGAARIKLMALAGRIDGYLLDLRGGAF